MDLSREAEIRATRVAAAPGRYPDVTPESPTEEKPIEWIGSRFIRKRRHHFRRRCNVLSWFDLGSEQLVAMIITITLCAEITQVDGVSSIVAAHPRHDLISPAYVHSSRSCPSLRMARIIGGRPGHHDLSPRTDSQ